MMGAMAGALTILALSAGAGLAADPSTTAYRFSSHPMISGTVTTVNDRQMVVNTDQGEQVTLELDSRTMAPRDLGPGMVMRAEFLALEDCRLYAQRIVPVRGGTSLNRTQGYANTRDSREVIGRHATALGVYHGAGSTSQAAAWSRENGPPATGWHSPGPAMSATPTTADYVFSTRAMISGEVVSVNDHRLVVVTDQGQTVGMAMDSRTMVPREIAPGSVIRAEFSELKDGRYYAKAISWIASSTVGREQAYARTRDSDFMIAQNVSDCGPMGAATQNTMTSAVVPAAVAATPAVVVAQSAPAPEPEPVVESPETLPQTASNQPLFLLLGCLALGAASVLAIGRRRWIA